MRICQGNRCCETGTLNTEDDNWELGLFDWIKLHSWDWAWHWVCPVHERLDYSMSYVAKW